MIPWPVALHDALPARDVTTEEARIRRVVGRTFEMFEPDASNGREQQHFEDDPVFAVSS